MLTGIALAIVVTAAVVTMANVWMTFALLGTVIPLTRKQREESAVEERPLAVKDEKQNTTGVEESAIEERPLADKDEKQKTKFVEAGFGLLKLFGYTPNYRAFGLTAVISGGNLLFQAIKSAGKINLLIVEVVTSEVLHLVLGALIFGVGATVIVCGYMKHKKA